MIKSNVYFSSTRLNIIHKIPDNSVTLQNMGQIMLRIRNVIILNMHIGTTITTESKLVCTFAYSPNHKNYANVK